MAKTKGENPDSHSYITEHFRKQIEPKIKDTSIIAGQDIYHPDDAVWKFEIPLENCNPSDITLDLLSEKMYHDGGLPKTLLTVETLEQIKQKLLQLDWEQIFYPKMELPSIIQEFLDARKKGCWKTTRENITPVTMGIASYLDCPFANHVERRSHCTGFHKFVWDAGKKEIQLLCPDFCTEEVVLSFSFRKFFIPNDNGDEVERERISIVWRDYYGEIS